MSAKIHFTSGKVMNVDGDEVSDVINNKLAKDPHDGILELEFIEIDFTDDQTGKTRKYLINMKNVEFIEII